MVVWFIVFFLIGDEAVNESIVTACDRKRKEAEKGE